MCVSAGHHCADPPVALLAPLSMSGFCAARLVFRDGHNGALLRESLWIADPVPNAHCEAYSQPSASNYERCEAMFILCGALAPLRSTALPPSDKIPKGERPSVV